MKIAAMLGIVIVMSLTACSGNPRVNTYAQERQAEQSGQNDSHILNTSQNESPVTVATQEVIVPETTKPADEQTKQEMLTVDRMAIQVGEKTFMATLSSGSAAKEFVARLPLTLSMSELHGNEKYHYLDQSLPTSSEAVGSIRSGDLMLYGSECLVLFYQDFSTSYNYTRLGSIDDPTGLSEALGGGGIKVTFQMVK